MMQVESTEIDTDQYLQESNFEDKIVELSKKISQRCKIFAENIFTFLHSSIPRASVIQMLEKFYFDKVITKSHLCGGILEKGMLAFRCQQCMLEDNSIICLQCFNGGKHLGHNFEKIQVFGGCCDCGDEEKWDPSGFCQEHQPIEHEIIVDSELTIKYLKEMQFILYVLAGCYYIYPDSSTEFKQSEIFGAQFVTMLRKYNQNSLVSGQMTFNLFASRFTDEYPTILSKNNCKITIFNEKIIEIFFRLKKYKAYCQYLVDLLTVMFAVPTFREYLTIFFTQHLIKDPTIIQSQIINITCQIYTSHKLIKSIIQQNRFPSINIKNLPPQTKFESVATIYYRYFIDLSYMARLYNGANKIAMTNQFLKGSVCDVFYYQKLSQKDIGQSIDYYGIEYIFFSYFYQMLESLRGQKQVLLKMIKDLFQEISMNENVFVYQTPQRCFILCLLMYFDGDFMQAFQSSFLTEIGLSIDEKLIEKIERMLKSSSYILKTYALTLSNRQFGHRYFTFFSFTFFKVDSLVAFDLLYFQFCVNLAKDYLYHKINRLFGKPIKEIQQFLDENKFETDHESIYDRGKLMGSLTDLIGLLIESQVSDFSLITSKAVLKILKEEQAFYFYGGMLASIDSIDIAEFKKVCTPFVSEQLPYFEAFVQKYAIWDGKKIKLSEEKSFSRFNFGYLKSKKLNRYLQKYLNKNLETISIQQKPNKLLLTNLDSFGYIFNEQFIESIIKIAVQYFSMLCLDASVLETDFAFYSRFIEQLIYLHEVIKIPKIKDLVEKISKTDNLMSRCTPYLKKLIIEVLMIKQQQKKSNEQEEEKLRKEELLNKKKLKLEKFKKKKEIATNFHIGQNKIEEQIENEEMFCVLCKNADKESLGILSFIQKSNLPMKNLLNSNRDVDILTSCNHLIHQKCYNQLYGQKQYAFCSICKTSCNLLLMGYPSEEKKQKMKEDNQEQDLEIFTQFNEVQKVTPIERIQVSFAMLDALGESGKKEQIEMEEQQKFSELSSFQKLFQSMIISVMNCLKVDSNYFMRFQSTCCHYVHQILTKETFNLNNLINIVSQQATKSPNWSLYKYIAQSILQSCSKDKIDDANWKQSDSISQQTQNQVKQILAFITCLEKIQKSELSFTITEHIHLLQLPQSLDILAKNIGECDKCHRITNEICLCLLCDFRSCRSCQVSDLTEHTFKGHSGACVFIQVDFGLPIYIGGKKSTIYESIYENILKEEYNSAKKDRSKYKLNHEKYENIEKDIKNYRIQQKIRYKELITFKQNTKRL